MKHFNYLLHKGLFLKLELPKKFLCGVGLIGIWLLPLAAMAQPVVLEAVDIGSLSGGQIQLRFRMSQPVDEPASFTVNEPARIVIDFLNTSNGLSVNQQNIGQGVAQRVVILEGVDRTRASVNLTSLVPYTVRNEGNFVLLTLGDDSGNATQPAAQNASVLGVSTQQQIIETGKTETGQIDFRRGTDGSAILNIIMASPSTTVNVRDEGSRIVAEFIGMRFPRGQERRLDVTDFGTPVSLVDALNKGANAEITISRASETEFLAYQSGRNYTIEVRLLPEPDPDSDDPSQRIFTGEPLSLNFQDIEVRAVLQIIADFTGLNVVVSDTVQGNLTLRLQNVPWDQALDIILRTKGLTQRQNGNVIYIAPTEEITAREKLELEARNQRIALIPLRSDVIQVNYAKAIDLKTLIEQRSGSGDDDISLLTKRGQISADPRTNTLLISEIPEKIAEVRDLVARLDIPVKQVLVDARVVIANDDFSRELGIAWGGAFVGQHGDTITALSGTLAGTDTITSSAIDNLNNTGNAFPVEVPGLLERLGVDLGVNAPTSSIGLAILGADFLVDLELSALQAEGRGEILSNPRVVTTAGSEATIKQGEEVTITAESRGSGIGGEQVSVSTTVDAFLELTVTPQIAPDGSVIMDLKITRDDVLSATPDLIRTANRELTTQARVLNGETIVLGGVFEKVSIENIEKVPFLGDLPAVGRLFRKNVNRDNKLELLMFITPRVINEGVTVR